MLKANTFFLLYFRNKFEVDTVGATGGVFFFFFFFGGGGGGGNRITEEEVKGSRKRIRSSTDGEFHGSGVQRQEKEDMDGNDD